MQEIQTAFDSFNPYEFYNSLLKRGMNPGLEGIGALLDELGRPQDGLCFVHIAGTNGKGSTATFLSSILTQAGVKNGLFTSPFVIDRRESIQLNNEMINEAEFKRLSFEIKKAVDRLYNKGIEITEFEAMTAAAIKHFADSECKIAVLEAGMGGRLDATDIIENTAVCVLTSISLDHVDFLGNDVEKIAAEKAGIIKRGSTVITADSQNDSVIDILMEKAKSTPAEMLIVKTVGESNRICYLNANEGIKKSISLSEPLNISNEYQKENAMLAVLAVKVLEGKIGKVPDSDVKAGIEKSFLPARLEVLSEEPFVLIDGGHNEAAIRALLESIDRNLSFKRLLGLTGMMRDKAYERVAELIGPRFEGIITTTPNNIRALDSATLASVFSEYCDDVTAVPCPADALALALEEQKNYDALIVFGSFYLAGEIRQSLLDAFKD